MDLDKEIMRFFLLGLNLLNGYRTEIVLLDHDELCKLRVVTVPSLI